MHYEIRQLPKSARKPDLEYYNHYTIRGRCPRIEEKVYYIDKDWRKLKRA